jgi:hypothetical protein
VNGGRGREGNHMDSSEGEGHATVSQGTDTPLLFQVLIVDQMGVFFQATWPRWQYIVILAC